MIKKRGFPAVHINSPVILGLFAISLLLLVINSVTKNAVNGLLACYFTAWKDPFLYLRLFTHVLVHQNLSHFTNNYLLLLVVGPMLEEKYGGAKLIQMMLFTGGVIGLVNVLFFPGVALIGASGLVFMVIILASFANIREGKLPMTVLLVGALYIGNEVIRGIVSSDNISQLSHIIGGICGAGFGFDYHGAIFRRKSR